MIHFGTVVATHDRTVDRTFWQNNYEYYITVELRQGLTFVKDSSSFNPHLANVPILYPLKTPENQRFSGVFRGYNMGILARNGLQILFDCTKLIDWKLINLIDLQSGENRCLSETTIVWEYFCKFKLKPT